MSGFKGVTVLDHLEIAREIVNALEDKKAENILLLDLRPDAIIADFFVLCTGNSDRQIKALADNVREVVKTQYGLLPTAVEGENTSGWVLMDYGNVIVHIFDEDRRRYYDLEGFWARQSHVVVSIQ
ncbi:MAG: ribosome silencing factor [bacterium]|nr:ribosome silencing factor [bacterium]